MNTIKNNKLIAKFIGMEYNKNSWYDNNSILLKVLKNNGGIAINLKFHESWDWLMPVIEKIQIIVDSPKEYLKEYPGLIDFNIDLSGASCEIFIGNDRLIGITAFEPGTLLNALYECVIEFIKWYNKAKK